MWSTLPVDLNACKYTSWSKAPDGFSCPEIAAVQ